MQLVRTRIEGVVRIDLEPRRDERGWFARAFCAKEFAAAGVDFAVAQVNLSANFARHTLRGMHLQRSPHGEAKVVICLKGRMFDVAVDLRPNSPTYLQWEAFELGEDLASAVYLDIGIAHGFLTLEPDTLVHYLMGSPYVADAADGVRWDDPRIGISWPAQPAVISERDSHYPLIGSGSSAFG